jgi:hypothetical protein
MMLRQCDNPDKDLRNLDKRFKKVYDINTLPV